MLTELTRPMRFQMEIEIQDNEPHHWIIIFMKSDGAQYAVRTTYNQKKYYIDKFIKDFVRCHRVVRSYILIADVPSTKSIYDELSDKIKSL